MGATRLGLRGPRYGRNHYYAETGIWFHNPALSTRISNAAGERSGALPGDVNKLVIRGDLIKGAEQAFRLGECLTIVVGFNLNQGVIYAQAIVSHHSLQVREIGLLPRQAFENIQQLSGRVIQGVIELHLVAFCALRVDERLFAEVGYTPVDV